MSGLVHVFADGSAHQGRGGFGVIVIRPTLRHFIASPLAMPCTNQIAEMMAVTIGLLCVPQAPGCSRRVRVYSDSAYVVNCWLEGWIEKWRRKDWRTSSNKPVANRPLWETMELAVALHNVEFIHMRGHGRGSEDPRWKHYNNRCDRLASAARSEGLKVNRVIPRRAS